MPWYLHRSCTRQGQDPAGWWSNLSAPFGGNLTCAGCDKEFRAKEGKHYNFNPNEKVLSTNLSSPANRQESGAQTSLVAIGVQPLIATSPRAGMSGGVTIEAQPNPGQDTLTPRVNSPSATQPAVLSAATIMPAETTIQPPTLAFKQLQDAKADVEKQLNRAQMLYKEVEILHNDTEKQKVEAVRYISALPDEDGKKAELNEKAKDLDSRLASSKSKHGDIQSPLKLCAENYNKLGTGGVNVKNKDHQEGYPALRAVATELAKELDLLVQEARPLKEEVNQLLSSAAGQLDGAAKLLVAGDDLTFQQLQDTQKEVENQLRRARTSCVEVEKLYKDAEAQKVNAVTNISALPDEDTRKAELNGKATNWDSKLASSKLKHSDIQSRLNLFEVENKKLSAKSLNDKNKEQIRAYQTQLELAIKLAEDMNVLVQQVPSLNEELKQLTSIADQAVAAARLLFAATKERAGNVKPRTSTQMDLKKAWDACKNKADVVESEKLAKANALLNEVKNGAPPLDKEKEFVRLLEEQAPRLEAVAKLHPNESREERANQAIYQEKKKAFYQAKTDYEEASRNLDQSEDPDRYKNALDALRGVAREAAKLRVKDASTLESVLRSLQPKNNETPQTLSIIFEDLRQKQEAVLKEAEKNHPKESDDAIADRERQQAMKDAFYQAKALYEEASTDFNTSTDPNRFQSALNLLTSVAGEADKLLKKDAETLASNLEEKLASAADKEPEALRESYIGDEARSMADKADPMVLRCLSGEEQVKLLKALRKAPGNGEGKGKDKVAALQTKVYLATKLEEDFLKQEKDNRKLLIQALTGDKEELMTARDTWPPMDGDNLDENKIIRIFTKMVNAHCRAMGFAPPQKIQLCDDKPSTSGGFLRDGKVILINRKGDTFNDFELVMDSIFHENSHSWQLQLVERIRGERQPPIETSDPLYKQALLFEANQGPEDAIQGVKDDCYDDKAPGYKAQPKEAHAHRAGPKTARALMRALE